MPKKGSPPLEGELLQGTLDLLILQTLVLGPAHGHTIAYAIEHRSRTSCKSSTGRSTRPCTGSRTAAGLPPSGALRKITVRPATTG